jgi:hypothetical protein
MAEHSRSSFSFEKLKDSIKITTRHPQNWSPFLLAILSLLALAAVTLFCLMRIVQMLMQDVSPSAWMVNILLILALAVAIYILIEVSRQAMDNAFLQEDVTITGKSITIERSGFLAFKKMKVIPADQIQCIQPTIQLSSRDSQLADVLMNTSKISKISIATRQKKNTYYPICRGISVDDMVSTLDRIHEKYPQYF